MKNPIKHTKEIIDLSGKLDWNLRAGNFDNSLDVIKKLRIKLNQVQKFLNEHEAI